ncbi:polysaccharide deacetylase family protein [Cellulomonas sp. SG140]|uniref:polysaccharide deacetylase family protein n=1 Tax=Cellulomonas sp. SG140 TaxID=2976536 RepID=UPI0021E97DDF|nr:polysaccharide deacetylase family protein [Cellulomonas sp. SG140]
MSRVATDRNVVALTFDAGSSNAGVASVLATLARYDVPATFFVTGQFARRYPADVRAVSAAGYPVGNHSDSHPDFTQTTTVEIQRQLAAAEASIRAATGHAAKPLFRFPYGARTAEDIHVVNDAGYVPFRWTVDTLGWKGTSGGQSVESVRARVLDAAQPGEIVLMHVGANPDDGSTLDAAALGSVIEGLRERGYSFITLRSLLP